MFLWREVLLKHMSYYQNILIQVVRLRCPQSDQVQYDVQVLSTLFFEFAKLLHLSTLYYTELSFSYSVPIKKPIKKLVTVNSAFL